jgi:hypothetical protein
MTDAELRAWRIANGRLTPDPDDDGVTTPPPFARAFRVRCLDGRRFDGVQFPSGRCVLDGPDGLVEAATAFEHHTVIPSLARVEWADGGDENGPTEGSTS